MSVSRRDNLRKVYQDACRDSPSLRRVVAQLRDQRPLPSRYLLEQAVMYQTLEYPPDVDNTLTQAGFVLSPDPAFIHASVRDWIRDNSLEWVTAEFSQLGIYDHQDLVNVACGLRSPQFRKDLLCALDPGAYNCATLETALRRYARPIDYPFVRSSNVTPRVEQSHEYLFNAAAWHHRLLEAEAEGKTRHREREDWIDSMIEDGEDYVGGVEEQVKVKKEEVKLEDMELSIGGRARHIT